MQEPKLNRAWLRVEGEAVGVFTNRKRLRMLEPFVGGECTVKAAAERANVPLNLMHYHAMKFLELGLLEVARLEARRGRAVKHYRAVADGFFLPYSNLPTATTEEHIAAFDAPMREALIRAIAASAHQLGGHQAWGRRFALDERGILGMFTGPDPEEQRDFDIIGVLLTDHAPAFWNSWDVLELEPNEAKAFQREVAALAHKYRNRGGGGRYLVRFALAPCLEPPPD